MQEDHFLASLTCFETLRVAAALKVKGSRSKREGVIEQSLGAVGLLKVAESQVCVKWQCKLKKVRRISPMVSRGWHCRSVASFRVD